MPDSPDHARFLRLYAEHEVALHAFVRSVLPSRQESSEVMQEVIVVLWKKFKSAREFVRGPTRWRATRCSRICTGEPARCPWAGRRSAACPSM